MTAQKEGTGTDGSAVVRVLVVEDTETTADLIRRSLVADGFEVTVISTIAGARERLSVDPPHVVVLDLELPDGSGLDLLREPISAGRVPMVILSSREAEMDRVLGLELGAEDYVVKPFFPRELATRVRRVAARGPVAGRQETSQLRFGPLHIDLSSRNVLVQGTPASLTDMEFDLLVYLASAPHRVFHRDDLLRAVWRSSPEWQSAKTVTEHIRRIRQKIEPYPARPEWIVTVGRAGYRFEPPT